MFGEGCEVIFNITKMIPSNMFETCGFDNISNVRVYKKTAYYYYYIIISRKNYNHLKRYIHDRYCKLLCSKNNKLKTETSLRSENYVRSISVLTIVLRADISYYPRSLLFSLVSFGHLIVPFSRFLVNEKQTIENSCGRLILHP